MGIEGQDLARYQALWGALQTPHKGTHIGIESSELGISAASQSFAGLGILTCYTTVREGQVSDGCGLLRHACTE